MRIGRLCAWPLRIVVLLGVVILAASTVTPSQAHAAPSQQVHLAQRAAGSPGKFEYHLISQGHAVISSISHARVPSATPYAQIWDCLNVYMNLINPQTDVVEVYASVQNYCGMAVTNLTLEWDTGVTCNGKRILGPHATYNIGTLNNQTGWGQISDWSTVCWSENYPYLPVAFTMAGYADAHANAGANLAQGSYDTPNYTFI